MPTLFRVHFVNGQHIDVLAESPAAARTAAKQKHPEEQVSKVKVVKGD